MKTYYMDLLINNGIMYEFKTAKTINGEHRKQALNYLLLAGLNHGKLVNMKPQTVQHEFVSTKLTSERRYKHTINDRRWVDIDQDSSWLKELMFELLSDWGAFLDTDLFYDAIKHFRGGEENVVKRIEVVNDSRVLGTQRAHLLNSRTAFEISAVTRNACSYEQHLRRLISHTSLRAIQWINLNHHNITFETISQQETTS